MAFGQLDDGEPHIAGARVALTHPNAQIDETITGADGVYAFTCLPSGSYQLDVTPPWGYGPSLPTTPLGLLLNPGNHLQLNFGHQRHPWLFMPMIVQ